MSKKTIELSTILQQMFNAEYDLKIQADYISGETTETATLFSGSPVYEYFITHYGDYTYIYSGLFGAVESFRISWESFLIRNKNNIDRRYAALIAEYNPLNNYDSTETETITGDFSRETEKTLNSEKTQTGTVTDSGETSATSKIYGYNSANGVNDSTATGTTANTRTDDLTNTDETSETETDISSDTKTRQLTRSGNIGVTTSAQMIKGELEIRTYDLALEIIHEFSKEYLYAVGE